MRILILGNTANSGYPIAKELRKMNYDVDLALNLSDSVFCFPHWEEGNIENDSDPIKLDPLEILNCWNSPDWIRYFDTYSKVPRKKLLLKKFGSRINLLKIAREYDFVESHFPHQVYLQFSGVPYVTFDTGWMRYVPSGNKFLDRLIRRGYKKSKAIILTNPDTYEIVDNLSYLDKEKIHFAPFSIDPEKYKPSDHRKLREQFVKDGELLLFSPTRQEWDVKGNDKMIKAYAKFVKKFPNSKFVIVSWSVDKERSKSLVDDLGISNNVIWITPVHKNKLIEYYNASDIVLEQFLIGSWGAGTLEAMSCGKPVLMFYNKNLILRAFGEEPPILNSFNEDEIYSNLVMLADDPKIRKDIGQKSRDWIIKTHSPNIVARRHLEIILNTIRR